MKNFCFNYKVAILSIYPLVAILLGLSFLIFSQTKGMWFGVIFLILALSFFAVLFLIEPIGYIINENGIKIMHINRKTFFEWKRIQRIETHYDVFFKILLVEDFCIVTNDTLLIQRKNRILKCRKTEHLLKQFNH